MDDHASHFESTEVLSKEDETKVEFETEKENSKIVDGVDASLSDRFSAFLVDSTIIAYLFSLAYPLFFKQISVESMDPRTWDHFHQGILAGTTAGLIFFYFFIFEGVLARTPGKFLCGLYVTSRAGQPVSITGALIRNLLRFVDIVLFPLTGMGLAETTRRHQRLGDIIAGTTVRRVHPDSIPVGDAREYELATVTRRSIALMFDMVIFLCAVFFYLTALPTHYEHLTRLLLEISPWLIVLYWVGCEWILGGTPAKLFFGMRVTHENGHRLRLPGALLRNLFRILDMNPLGYLCAILSTRKQRPGDLAAHSAVIRTQSSLQNMISFLMIIFLIGGLGYFGHKNMNNFIRSGHVIRVGPWQVQKLPSLLEKYFGSQLKISDISLATNQETLGTQEPYFLAGDMVRIKCRAQGFIAKNNAAKIQQDLFATNDEGQIMLTRINIIDQDYSLSDGKAVTLTSEFVLPQLISPGTYHLKLRVRDLFGHQTAERTQTFHVK
jgi:uncharacterized RDD family membrane protein YckC